MCAVVQQQNSCMHFLRSFLYHFISVVVVVVAVVVFLICLSWFWMHFANRNANDALTISYVYRYTSIYLYRIIIIIRRYLESAESVKRDDHLQSTHKQKAKTNSKCTDEVKLCAAAESTAAATAASPSPSHRTSYICYLWVVKTAKNIKNIYTFTSCVHRVTCPIIPSYIHTHIHTFTVQIHAIIIFATVFRVHPRIRQRRRRRRQRRRLKRSSTRHIIR